MPRTPSTCTGACCTPRTTVALRICTCPGQPVCVQLRVAMRTIEEFSAFTSTSSYWQPMHCLVQCTWSACTVATSTSTSTGSSTTLHHRLESGRTLLEKVYSTLP
eukprot:scpid26016/ scgid31039/ 